MSDIITELKIFEVGGFLYYNIATLIRFRMFISNSGFVYTPTFASSTKLYPY